MKQRRFSIEELNTMNARNFAGALAGVFEKSAWVPELVWRRRPFKTVDDLHEALCRVVREAEESKKLHLIRAHPELANPAQQLTAESRSEQSSAALDRLPHSEKGFFADLNRRYRERFGFPFVICVKQHGSGAILENFQKRLNNTPVAEMNSAIDEICKIAYFRLLDLTG